MKDKNHNQNGIESGVVDVESTQDFATQNATLSENNYIDKGTESGAEVFVHDDENSLGEFTDKVLVDGVVATGIFGDNLQVEENEISTEQRALSSQKIDVFYSDDAENQVDNVSADEFENMDNVIDGVHRKPHKKKKRKTKVRKIVVRTYCTVFIAVIGIVMIYFGATFFQVSPTQGMDGADLRVDMKGLPHKVGTDGADINLKQMFPDGSDFKKTGGNSTINSEGILKISPSDTSFKLTYTETKDEKVESVEREIEVIKDAVNVSDWDSLSEAIKEEKIVCLQTAYLAAPVMEGEKAKTMSGFKLKNDLYGNGCKLNVFEIVCCRNKNSGGKLTTPYLQGNGPTAGYTAFAIGVKEGGEQITMQDLHIVGNDMITEEGGNLEGVNETIIQKRGLKLFSRYGHLVSVSGDTEEVDGGMKGEKANFKLKHCVLENGHQLIHVRHSNMDFEGNIIRNASDTTLSVATYANERSVINSKDNVIANSLTGGVVFYCYDGNISEDNAENSWNELNVVEGSFLDIYNWKLQDGLAFMPETESGSEIANPVAKSEIPKKDYDNLKAAVDGKKYIHFAIIKLRTGGGLAKNGSYVKNYESLGYQTTRNKGYENGFPLPKIAAAIIKDIDVWGYYEKSDGAVSPIAVLDGNVVETLYEELKFGRKAA